MIYSEGVFSTLACVVILDEQVFIPQRAHAPKARGHKEVAMKVIVEADGGARGNPGPAGYGALVRDAVTGNILVERHEYLGVATNNVAEYSGLIAGLEAATELGATEVDVRMDSKLVIEQMAGRWRVKHPNMRPLAVQAQALAREFARIHYTWIPREQNKDADALANQAMDAG